MRETILSSVRADPARARAHDRRNKRLGAEYAKAQSPRKRHRASENLVSSFFLSSSASSTGESTPPRSALISEIKCLKDPEGVRKSSGFFDLHYRPVTYAWKGEVATAMHAFIDDEDHGQQVQSGMAR